MFIKVLCPPLGEESFQNVLERVICGNEIKKDISNIELELTLTVAKISYSQIFSKLYEFNLHVTTNDNGW